MPKNNSKILIAPCAYKGSLTASQVAQAIATGLLDIVPDAQTTIMPLADGGDGTIEAIRTSLGGTIKKTAVIGPITNIIDPMTNMTGAMTNVTVSTTDVSGSGANMTTSGRNVTTSATKRVMASWLILPDRIIVELAKCCGLALLDGQPLHPLNADTFGLGEIISDCLAQRTKRITIGVGGSASTDGGTGALSALGIKFLDSNNNPLPLGGGYLSKLATIDLSTIDPRLKNKEIEILTDVNSPLLGPSGAAVVFGPQKGASPEDIKILEVGLERLADVVQKITGNDLRNTAGSGAAGGTAFGLASLLNACILPGFKTIAELIKIKEQIEKSDLVITAEGRLDHQSLSGKATGELAKMCKDLNKPLWILPASAEENISWHNAGITIVSSTAQNNKQATAQDIIRITRQLAKTV